MRADRLIEALRLPDAARVDRRVSKALLTEHGAPTPADRRRLNEGIDEVTWLAALKPTTVGVPEFRDETREYLEIAVLRMIVRQSGGRRGAAARLVELVHRAVPYPVILITDDRPAGLLGLSAAHKRWSQAEAGRTVLASEMVTVEWPHDSSGDEDRPLLDLSAQPRHSMLALYQGWLDTLTAILARRITGSSAQVVPDGAVDRLLSIREWEEVGVEIDRLRSAARKEKQMARRIELNLAIKRLEARQTAIRGRLQ